MLPIFQTFCPDGVYFAQTVVYFAFFKSGQEKGCFGVELGVLCVRTYPQKGCVTAE